MEQDILDEVTDWVSEPVGSGYEGLRDLAAGDFSGAVTTGSAWVFVLNGRLLGPVDGDLATFEDATLTAYAAPDPAVTLLFAMRATGGETRARYYTNDTPLSEANDTLTAGNFTGYIELSENVLSGDYYVSYYGGKSMSVAWVGNSRRLLTGDDAFDQANDEVGIYEVTEVDLDLVDVPDPSTDDAPDEDSPTDDTHDEDAPTDDADEQAAAFGTSGETATDDGSGGGVPTDAPEVDPLHGQSPEETEGAVSDRGTVTDAGERDEGETETRADVGDSDGPAEPTNDEERRVDAETTEGGVEPDDDSETADHRSHTSSGQPVTFGGGDSEVDEPISETDRPGSGTESEPGTETPDSAAGEDRADVFSEEERWREARAIPALDPSDTAASVESAQNGNSHGAKRGSSARTRRRAGRTTRGTPRTESTTPEEARKGDRGAASRDVEQSSTGRGAASTRSGGPTEAAADRLETLESERDQLQAERDELASRVETLESEREELETGHAELRAERDKLRSRVDELEAEVESLQAELDSASLGLDAEDGLSPERSMTPAEALRGTNLFVRYDNKGKPTLRSAHSGDADPAEVNENLRLEYHTTFDAHAVGVDGEPFEDFLEGTIEYNFVDWVVRKLIYEIRDSGNETDLDGLYDAIPEIDRIELRGTVEVGGTDGDEPESHDFDVVLWDGMGDPLLVANLNDSREAASGGMVQTLTAGGRSIAAVNETFGGAFLVTSSFFDPEALEMANEETGAGLLSRSRRKSFVKLSRKSGFHLCLVEARNDEFYVNFPDL